MKGGGRREEVVVGGDDTRNRYSASAGWSDGLNRKRGGGGMLSDRDSKRFSVSPFSLLTRKDSYGCPLHNNERGEDPSPLIDEINGPLHINSGSK